MSDPIVSTSTFYGIITGLTIGGTFWASLDVIYMSRMRGKDLSDPITRDKVFGYMIGILVTIFTTVGILRFHDVL